jgi:hypothetical protein
MGLSSNPVKYLPEIIRVLDRFREPRVETLDATFRKKTREKTYLLYKGIRTGDFASDSAAADAIYKTQSTDPRYTTLKGNLKRRLLNSLFHLNLKRVGFSESAQAGYYLKKRSFIVHTLVTLGARSAAMRIAERCLEIATKYNVTDIAYEMALLLRTNAGLYVRQAAYERYDKLVKRFLEMLVAEQIAWEYFDRVNMTSNRFTGGLRRFADEFQEYVARLEKVKSQYSSFSFLLNYYRVKGVALGAAGAHAERIDVMEEAVRYLQSVPHLAQRVRFGEFKMQQVDSYLRIGRLQDAERIANESLDIFSIQRGVRQNFSLQEFRLLIFTNTLRFEEALALYFEVTGHFDFQTMADIVLERWRIYEYYLHYATQRTGAKSPFHHRFNIDSLLALTPAAGRDKVGMNVALRILQILYLLEDGKFAEIFDRMESLMQYRARYLVAKVTRASSLFLKLLKIMENNSFAYERTKRQGARYYHQLKTETFDVVDSEQELQVLPYTWLWDRILERLEQFEKRGAIV